jgi:hypothetical protein
MERNSPSTVQLTLEVPDRLAREASAAGLLTRRAIARMFADAVRRAAVDRLLAGAKRAGRGGGRAMSLRAIQAEVNAVRRKQKALRRST